MYDNDLKAAWAKANKTLDNLTLLGPQDLTPTFAAKSIITLLQKVYFHHAVTDDQITLENEIRKNTVLPWIMMQGTEVIACATLITHSNGEIEIGRAVSLKRGSSAGTITILTAAKEAGSKLTATVRLAAEFEGIPSSIPAQKISYDILKLTPHAALPAFSHGSPTRVELFACSSMNKNDGLLALKHEFNKIEPNNSKLFDIKITQRDPFTKGHLCISGENIETFVSQARTKMNHCTIVKIEVNAEYKHTYDYLLDNNFVVSGYEQVVHNKPTHIILSTLGRGTTLAPIDLNEGIPANIRNDIAEIYNSLRKII